MKWRWLFFDYVDPALGLPRAVRRQIRREAFKYMRSGDAPDVVRGCRSRLLFLAAALTPGAAMACAMSLWFATGQSLHVGVVILFQFTLVWLASALIGRWSWRPAVFITLDRHGYDVCYACGYWLRGLDEETNCCPECGRERDHIPRGSA